MLIPDSASRLPPHLHEPYDSKGDADHVKNPSNQAPNLSKLAAIIQLFMDKFGFWCVINNFESDHLDDKVRAKEPSTLFFGETWDFFLTGLNPPK